MASMVSQQAARVLTRTSSRLALPSLALISSPSCCPSRDLQRTSSTATLITDRPSDKHQYPSSSSLRSVLSSKTSKRHQPPRPRLIIFDKDGTLICFHSLWIPWVRSFAERVEEATGLNIMAKVYNVLGFCPVLEKVKRGLLAEGTIGQIRERVAQLLVQHGVEKAKASDIVEHAIKGTASSSLFTEHTVRQLHDLETLFGKLKLRGIKIAICTADSRRATMHVLKALGVEELVDLVVCGDDSGSMPKPHPQNALFICRQLGVEPKDAMVIGDTPADMGMGRLAKLGSTVGVLSGIGDHEELAPEADHLVEDVGELIPLIG